MSIFAPRLRASTIRRSELARVGPVSVPVWRRDFLFSARPEVELSLVSGRPAVRLPAVASMAARSVSRPIPRVLSTSFANQPLLRPQPFPSLLQTRGPIAEHTQLHNI